MRRAEVIKITNKGRHGKASLQLESGRGITAQTVEKEDLIEITEPGGQIVLRISMTDAGPVITAEGAHLKLKSTEAIKLEAKRIDIRADEEASLSSKGQLNVESSQELKIHSDEDVEVQGKLIHLN